MIDASTPNYTAADHWIQTRSGLAFSLTNPTPDRILLEDIAYPLARIARFNGHTLHREYSVAEHSIRVAAIVPPELKLPALLHDAHEAYIGDISRPVCRYLYDAAPGFRWAWVRLKESVDKAIAGAFGFDAALFDRPEIKHADNVLLATEARDLLSECEVPWSTSWNLPVALEKRIPPSYFPDDKAEWFMREVNVAWGQMKARESSIIPVPSPVFARPS